MWVTAEVCMFYIKKQLQRTITVLRYFLLDLPVQDLTNSSFPLVQISMNIWEFRKWFSLYNILRDYTYFFLKLVNKNDVCARTLGYCMM